MNRLLLDTQVAIWADSDSPRLRADARDVIRNANVVYVSAASEWELAIKAALGKLIFKRSILESAVEAGFEPLAITFQHAQAVRLLKPIHSDPFDRLLVAVASVENLTLVTSDPLLARYPISVLEV